MPLKFTLKIHNIYQRWPWVSSPVMALPSLGNPWHKASTSFPCMYMRYILFIFLQVQRSVGRGDHPYLKIRKPRIWQCLQEWPGTEVPAGRFGGMVGQRNPSAQSLLSSLQGYMMATRVTETQREICLLQNSIHPLHRSSLTRWDPRGGRRYWTCPTANTSMLDFEER